MAAVDLHTYFVSKYECEWCSQFQQYDPFCDISHNSVHAVAVPINDSALDTEPILKHYHLQTPMCTVPSYVQSRKSECIPERNRLKTQPQVTCRGIQASQTKNKLNFVMTQITYLGTEKCVSKQWQSALLLGCTTRLCGNSAFSECRQSENLYKQLHFAQQPCSTRAGLGLKERPTRCHGPLQASQESISAGLNTSTWMVELWIPKLFRTSFWAA